MTAVASDIDIEEGAVSVFDGHGELFEADGNNPFFINDPDAIWFVESGQIQLFVVGNENGEPTGARSHFVTLDEGEFLCGMDLDRYGMGNGFLAVGRVGTLLRRMDIDTIQDLSEGEQQDAIVEMLDVWVAKMSRKLTADIIPGPLVDVNLDADEEIILENSARARSNKEVLWLSVPRGNLLYIGLETLVFEEEAAPEATQHSIVLDLKALEQSQMRLLFPLTADTWVEASNAGDGETQLTGHSTDKVISMDGLWNGLELFHEALCQCEFINKKLAVVDEYQRLKTKAEYSEAARDEAMRELASVLQGAEDSEQLDPRARQDAVLQSCMIVGKRLGMKIRQHPEANPENSFERQLQLIGKASQFRMREVALRDEWWTLDQGPLLGRLEENEEPIAILPTSARSYEFYAPASDRREKISDQNVDQISVFAKAFYRPFPAGDMTVGMLAKFSILGLRRDFLVLAAMGITLGLLGSMSPYFTGQIIDSAIPQASRNILFQFGAALLLSAMVQVAFKLTQSVSMLRIQGKMDYSAQAALWDRLLNLPTNFFRDYSAGDLADRAGGVSQIRGLIAGAGVSSILGSFSSVFYVFLMFRYSLVLGLTAMGLTALFISVSFTCNYLQLRYQRTQLTMLGAIRGLVLQLISGVSKLRVAGAEHHAFREWATEFAEARRIGFKVGRIQNVVQVFNSGFNVVSSMVIFFALAALQQSQAAEGGGDVLSTGEFIAFNAAYGAFLTASMSLSDASLQMLKIVPIFERMKPILTTEPEINELKAYPGKLKGEIELSHVHFRYVPDGPWIIKDVSLKIAPGEFVALVGGSGSGKSTLMRMMLGFEIPEKGSVYYDGQDLSTLDIREVRAQIGVVLQDSRVFPTDIYRNIVGTNDSLTTEDAWEAAAKAAFAEDIQQMPMSMHTYVSDSGGGLSGGQKQRLLIARALVKKPRILYLDEATSALDNRTQAIVTESMAKMQATRIAIAHRLSTIADADRIIVLHYGQIIEEGGYDELIELDGMFASLAKRQEV